MQKMMKKMGGMAGGRQGQEEGQARSAPGLPAASRLPELMAAATARRCPVASPDFN